MVASPRSSWNIGLSAWIIQDGNYPDFTVGQTAEFAVEYYRPPGTGLVLAESAVSAQQVSQTVYEVVAEKVLETDEVTVLDIGILTYREEALQFPEVATGNRFSTQLELEVDPYFYFERISKNQGIPPLIYSWRIDSILRQTAPFIDVIPDSGPWAGQKMMIRDASKLGYEEISKTDAWQDDNGTAEYVLCCDLLPVPAKHLSATAT